MQFIPKDSPGSRLLKRKVKIDSKGRISIPSEIRKNFRLDEDSEIELLFDLKRNFVILVFKGCSGSDQIQSGCLSDNNGQDGVTVSTVDCGSASPGSKESMTQVKPESSETPGPGLKKDKRRGMR